MDIMNSREDLDQPNISVQESQELGPRAPRGNSAMTGALKSVARGLAGAEVFPYHGCGLKNPKDECQRRTTTISKWISLEPD